LSSASVNFKSPLALQKLAEEGHQRTHNSRKIWKQIFTGDMLSGNRRRWQGTSEQKQGTDLSSTSYFVYQAPQVPWQDCSV